MRVVNIHTAKTHLSRLLNEAAAGEAIVIVKAGETRGPLAAIRTAFRAAWTWYDERQDLDFRIFR